MNYPTLKLKLSGCSSYTINKTGDLSNQYSPLLNLITDKGIGDFTTKKFNFDRYTPVDIIVTDEYDGSENLIINDDKNKPKLINSRVSIQENKTFRIPEHIGNTVSNVYEEENFEAKTNLLKLYNNIPSLTFDGLKEGGSLKCGSYVFYFKLSDSDGNLTNIVQESGIVLVHIGQINSSKIRMGLLDENSEKSILFTLSGLDSGFDYVRVFYERTSSDLTGAVTDSFFMINLNFPIVNKKCQLTITGSEEIIQISKFDILNEFADIQSAKTQEISQNILFLGNTTAYALQYKELLTLAWKIIPREIVNTNELIGRLDSLYNSSFGASGNSGCYLDVKNVYNYTGYWPDEYYRFGVVFIYENNLLSPVFNIQGVDFNLLNSLPNGSLTGSESLVKNYINKNLWYNKKVEIVHSGSLYSTGNSEIWDSEPEDCIFKKNILSNSKGVVHFSRQNLLKSNGNILSPNILGIQFDMSMIGYDEGPNQSRLGYKDTLEKYHIKGLFFVRLKRIPTILAQGLVIGLTGKDFGSIPVILNNGIWITKSFLSNDEYSNRLLIKEGSDLVITSEVKTLALLIPDSELLEAAYNSILNGQEFYTYSIGRVDFENRIKNSISFKQISSNSNENKTLTVKLTNVPIKTKLLTDGENYFSTLAGDANEPYKTSNVNLIWNRTPPLDLTTSTSLIRGEWGTYVGMSDNNYSFGDIINIKKNTFVTNPNLNELEFKDRFADHSLYSAISDRLNVVDNNYYHTCYRGDCFTSIFTHRMMNNFIDPELPTNTEIIDPACWAKNYAVRCTAEILGSAHSNLTGDSGGWYIPSPVSEKKSTIVSLIFGILTGNIGMLIKAAKELSEDTPRPTLTEFNNEIALAFEVFTGAEVKEKEDWWDTGGYDDNDTLKSVVGKGHIKKVNPVEQEANSSGLNLKAIFKSDDKWELHGLASINRADVNAVSFGLWITFPICSSLNLQLRDIDFNLAVEEASFSKKRSFYPLLEMGVYNHLPESNTINGAAKKSICNNQHIGFTAVPFVKQEYFNRIYYSKPNITQLFINSYRMIFLDLYKEYNKEFGCITKLVSLGDNLMVIFEHGIGLLPINRTPSNDAERSPYLPSRAVLPELVSIITPDYGSIWKLSVLKVPDSPVVYGVDTIAKKIWKCSTEGLEFISDHKISKFLNDFITLSEYDYKEYQGHINIKTHYNAFKHDVIFTFYKDIPETYSKSWLIPEQYKGYTVYYIDYNDVDSLGAPFIKYQGNKIRIGETESGDPIYLTAEWADTSEVLTWTKGNTWSLCYNEVLLKWITFYDWYPVESCNIDNIFFSFDKELLDSTWDKSNNTIELVKLKYLKLEIKDYPYSYTQSKSLIDKTFSNKSIVYNIDSSYEEVSYLRPIILPPGKYLSAYVTNPNDWINFLTVPGLQLQDNYTFIYHKNQRLDSTESILIPNFGKYKLAELKISDYDESDLIDKYPLTAYKLRNSELNRMYLWKHGMAGLYDNEGKIKPTNWYGKQHEFNFEFVVNETSLIQKIFNNLKIISNKTAPNKFEYEIVGEGYEWFEYKPIIKWINELKVSDPENNPDEWWKYVLSTSIDTIKVEHPDFPDFDRVIKKLPYIKNVLTDRKGRKDRSYNPEDAWSKIDKTKSENDFALNSNETALLYDEQLNENCIRTELLGNDMKKFGRVRGNMEYLEDLWNIEIRPINYKWCYISGEELEFTNKTEARHRDKHVKIKVRYSGKDLAVILAVLTMFDYSFA